jgi:hypothetical protein
MKIQRRGLWQYQGDIRDGLNENAILGTGGGLVTQRYQRLMIAMGAKSTFKRDIAITLALLTL